MESFTTEQRIEYEKLMDAVSKAYPGVPRGLAEQTVECWVENPSVISKLVAEHKKDPDCFLTEEDKENARVISEQSMDTEEICENGDELESIESKA